MLQTSVLRLRFLLRQKLMLKSHHVVLYTVHSEHGSQKHTDNAILPFLFTAVAQMFYTLQSVSPC